MKNRLLFLALAFLMLSATSTAYGQLTFSFVETDIGVESFGEGTLDLFGLNFAADFASGGFVLADFQFDVGPPADVDIYVGNVAGPTTLNPDGPFDTFSATESAGDTFGFNFGSNPAGFFVPDGYVSNDPLSGSAFYSGETLETLGLLQGQFNWVFEGNTAVTLNVSVAPVPEPTASLILPVLFVLAAASRRRMA